MVVGVVILPCTRCCGVAQGTIDTIIFPRLRLRRLPLPWGEASLLQQTRRCNVLQVNKDPPRRHALQRWAKELLLSPREFGAGTVYDERVKLGGELGFLLEASFCAIHIIKGLHFLIKL